MDDDPNAKQYLINSIRAAMDNVRRRTNAPFGAVIARQGKIIATAVNEVDDLCDPTAHAEIAALRDAARTARNYRLPGCELYVTLEPCAMCAGAIYWAGISRVVFGLREGERLATLAPLLLAYPVLVLGAVRAGLAWVNGRQMPSQDRIAQPAVDGRTAVSTALP